MTTIDDATTTVPIDPDTLDAGPTLVPRTFEALAVPLPPMLEEALGYLPLRPERGGGRWLAVGPWRARPEVRAWEDGQVSAPVDERGWMVWSRHAACRFALCGRVVAVRGEPVLHLVLDRLKRSAYAAPAADAGRWVRDQWPAPAERMTPEATAVLAADLARFLAAAPVEISPAEINAAVVRRQAVEARLRAWLDRTGEAAAARRQWYARRHEGQPPRDGGLA